MTDNGSPADANAASDPVDDFPSKLRVHALARMLGLTSRQVLAHLVELGGQTRSPQSSVDRETARAVAERVRGQALSDDGAAVPAVAQDESALLADSVTASAEAEPAKVDAEVVAPKVENPEAQAPEAKAAEATIPSLFSAAEAVSHQPILVADEVASGPLFLQPQAHAPAKRAQSAKTAAPDRDAANIGAGDNSDTGDSADAAQDSAAANSGASNSGVITSAGSDSDGDDFDGDDADRPDSDRPDADRPDADGSDADESAGEAGRNRRRRRGRRGRGRGRGDQNDRSDDSDDSSTDGDTQVSSGASKEADEDAVDEAGREDSDTTDDEQPRDTDSAGSGGSGSRPAGKRTRKTKRGPNSDAATDDDADKNAADKDAGENSAGDTSDSAEDGEDDGDSPNTKRRRRRRRRKGGGESDEATTTDDPPNTVVHEREPRSKRVRDEVQGISGSTRLEAKRQRRRDGRDAGRRRPPILSESEFLARREAVERVMVVRERSANTSLDHGSGEHPVIEDYTQVAVLEDGVLVEHFVTTETSSSMVGNIYLGRVQNVLPGMEAAFVDIGRGRNGVLYAGEVNWDAAGLDGGSRKIEQALKPGDNVVVQVSKDPVGHKGARLTTQISLAGRYLVYVPGGSSTGISRKLPDVERKRLKQILAKLVPDDAGVIIRTASEGVSAEDLGTDIERLESKWKSIETAVGGVPKKGSGSVAPRALYEEPDLLVRVVRDLFNEDFRKLVVEGDKAWNLVEGYVSSVAPDLLDRVEQFTRAHADAPDSFVVHRIDEQLAKALDRKVWLPSGGTLIIEHTEAMTVVDVNTGKFTGSGGNLEETVTRNNLEAAEEIVRQMRLRDIGGMIVVDFIDMVLESNRDLVLRRLTEALARDRTRHQVSEVTSLGLVQMTRKRLGTGLLEAFSTTCTTCAGRGVIVHSSPVEINGDDSSRTSDGASKRARRGKQRKGEPAAAEQKPAHSPAEHPMFRAMAAHTTDDDIEPVEIERLDEADMVSDADSVPSGAAGSDADSSDAAAPDSAAGVDSDASGPDTVGTDTGDSAVSPDSDASPSETGNARQGTGSRRSRSSRGANRNGANRNRNGAEGDDSGSLAQETGRDGAAQATPRPAAAATDAGATNTDTAAADTAATDTQGTHTQAVDTAVADTTVADTAGSVSAGESATAPPAARKTRRRVARRAASPTGATEAVIIAPRESTPALSTQPLTTFGPASTQTGASQTGLGQTGAVGSGATESAVAVRRRPRRRAAGRPAGPPVED